jgi:hypothetical protein
VRELAQKVHMWRSGEDAGTNGCCGLAAGIA